MEGCEMSGWRGAEWQTVMETGEEWDAAHRWTPTIDVPGDAPMDEVRQ
jgi:hypothetical protein